MAMNAVCEWMRLNVFLLLHRVAHTVDVPVDAGTDSSIDIIIAD